MISQSLFIKNRNKKKIAVTVDVPPSPKGLAFIMHGLGGFKEQKHIVALSKTFTDSRYTVVRFDCRDSIGQSEGSYEYATATSYYKDLKDILTWAKKQKWYHEPFFFVGHSVGSMCMIKYAQKNPKQIAGIVSISTVVNGKLQIQNYDKKMLAEWKKTGFRIRPSGSMPGVIFKLRYNPHIPDKKKWDVLKEGNNITMPILMMVGDKDTTTPSKHIKILFEKIRGKKEFHIIKGADHFFYQEKHIKDICVLVKKWIRKVEKYD